MRERCGQALDAHRTMSADRSAAIVLEAACKRKRHVGKPPWLLAQRCRLFAPGLSDHLSAEVYFKPAVPRVRAARR